MSFKREGDMSSKVFRANWTVCLPKQSILDVVSHKRSHPFAIRLGTTFCYPLNTPQVHAGFELLYRELADMCTQK
jgi:hypothetical protein